MIGFQDQREGRTGQRLLPPSRHPGQAGLPPRVSAWPGPKRSTRHRPAPTGEANHGLPSMRRWHSRVLRHAVSHDSLLLWALRLRNLTFCAAKTSA